VLQGVKARPRKEQFYQIDVFATGLVLYVTFTGGAHPFGQLGDWGEQSRELSGMIRRHSNFEKSKDLFDRLLFLPTRSSQDPNQLRGNLPS
jgi:hypothetical protein